MQINLRRISERQKEELRSFIDSLAPSVHDETISYQEHNKYKAAIVLINRGRTPAATRADKDIALKNFIVKVNLCLAFVIILRLYSADEMLR